MNWKNWLLGLVYAFVTGMGTGLTMVIVDPAHFNFGTEWHHLVGAMLAFGLVAFFAYLKDSRPPSWKDSIPTVAEVKKSVGVGAVLLAVMLAGAANTACGPKQYHTAVAANTGLAQAIFVLQDSEIAAHKDGLITDAKHATYKAQILRLLQAGDDLTVALQHWDPNQPAPANVGTAIADVQRLLSDLKLDSPQADRVIFAVQTVLSVLRGTGVLPGDELEVAA